MLGIVAWQPGHYGESLAAYQRASVLVTRLGYEGTRMAVDLFQSWGFALLNAGRTAEAEDVLHHALASSREAQVEGGADELVLYGNERALRELGRFKEAGEYAERAYAKAQAAKDNLISDQLLLEQARVYIGQGNFAGAAVLVAKAEPLIGRDYPSGDFMFAMIASDHSMLAEGAGNLPAALRFADEAVKVDENCIKAGRPGAYVLPRLLTHRSALYLQAHDYDKARADAERALGLLQAEAGPGTFSTYIGRAYLAVGHALVGQGKSEQARSAFRSAADHLQHGLGADQPETRTARQLAGL